MGRKALSERDNWQASAGRKGKRAEQNLYDVFDEYFANTKYTFIKQPKNFKGIYSSVKLSDEVAKEIFNFDVSKKNYGMVPDFAIKNNITGKTLFGEVKRQDGWVEGGNPSDGRGNVHERGMRLFSPGLLKKIREVSGISNEEIVPFWIVFQGNITRDPKRVREITFFFDKYEHNFFLWYPKSDGKALINHFEKFLLKYLD